MPALPDETIKAALDRVLSWPEIARSVQLGKFLTYIVHATLNGREDAIKAYAIAVDVFGRPVDFDPQADPIVRVQARRLRALLDQYYEEADDPGPVRIRLPVGRYVPQFETIPERQIVPVAETTPPPVPDLASPATVESALARPRHWQARAGQIVIAVALVAMVALAAAVWLDRRGAIALLADLPAEPRLTILEFQDLLGRNDGVPVVGGLALELVTDLQLFGDIAIGYGEPKSGPVNLAASAEQAPVAGGFVLSGVAREAAGQVQYGAILRRRGSEEVVWSHAISANLDAVGESSSIDAVSRAFSMMLGSHRGPLDASARTWLGAQTDMTRVSTPYLCRLQYHVYRDTNLMADRDRTGQCVEALLAREPTQPTGLAISAVLDAEAVDSREDGAQERLAHAGEVARQAVSLAPTSGFAWEQLARVMEEIGDREQADIDYAAALQLNPANDDALAGHGRMLAMTRHWQRGQEAARLAVTGTPEPPPWYYTAPALNALREHQFAVAIRYAETITAVDRELGPVVAVVAATAVGNVSVVNRYLPQVVEQQRFRSQGIMTRLGKRISDPDLLALVRENLLKAQVPAAALDNPF